MFFFILIFFLFTFWMMNRIFLGVQPGSNMIKTDVKRIRAESDKHLEELVAWSNEELDLLSFNVERKLKKRGFGRSEQGFFKSIYQEKMFFYAIKEYVATSKRIVIYARTKDNELIFQINKGITQVYFDAEFLGKINNKGEFINDKTRRFFGSVRRPNKSKTLVYNEQDELLGAITVPENWETAINPRATDMEKELDSKDLLLFKILAIYEMILVHMEKNK